MAIKYKYGKYTNEAVNQIAFERELKKHADKKRARNEKHKKLSAEDIDRIVDRILEGNNDE